MRSFPSGDLTTGWPHPTPSRGAGRQPLRYSDRTAAAPAALTIKRHRSSSHPPLRQRKERKGHDHLPHHHRGTTHNCQAGTRQAGRARRAAFGASGRPASTRLFGIAVVVVVAAFLGSLITLSIYAPNGSDHSLLSGPAVAAGVLGMYTAVGGGLLGFIAAVRSEDAQ